MAARQSDGTSLVTRPPDESAVLSVFGLDALKASGAANHVGVAVRDVDEAIGRYGRLFGIRQWRRIRFSCVAQYRGSLHRITGTAATGSLGAMTLEVVAPGEGRWTASDVLAERGECAYHVGFRVSDLARALDESRAAGLTPTLVGTDESGTPAFGYIESPEPAAVLIELVAERLPPSFLTEATTRTVR
jgi:catechol 2,3-dioxygenase-like lactoylglutathione lyase family enzyme